MNRVKWLAVVGLTALTVATMASSVAAQITDPPQEPPPTVPTAPAPVPVVPRTCYVPQYDLNGDKRLSDVDFNQWKRWFLDPECQRGAGTCHPGMDMDGNGVVEWADLYRMFEHYRVCVEMSRRNIVPAQR